MVFVSPNMVFITQSYANSTKFSPPSWARIHHSRSHSGVVQIDIRLRGESG